MFYLKKKILDNLKVNYSLFYIILGFLVTLNFLTKNLIYINVTGDIDYFYEATDYFYQVDKKFYFLENFSFLFILLQFLLLFILSIFSKNKKTFLFIIIFSLIFSIKFFNDPKDFISALLIPIFSFGVLVLDKKPEIKKNYTKILFYLIFIFTNLLSYKLHIEINSYIYKTMIVKLTNLELFFVIDHIIGNFLFSSYPINHKNCFIFIVFLMNIFFLKKNILNFNYFFLLFNIFFLLSYLINSNTYIQILSIFSLFIFFIEFEFLKRKKILIILFVLITLSHFAINSFTLNLSKNFINHIYSLDSSMLKTNCSDISKNFTEKEARQKYSLSDFENNAIFHDKSGFDEYINFLPNCINAASNLKFVQIGMIKRAIFQDKIYSLIKSDYKSFLFFGLSKKNYEKMLLGGFFPHNSYLSIMIKYGLIFYILFFFLLVIIFKKNRNIYLVLFFVLFSLTQIFDDYLLGNRSELTFFFWYMLSLLKFCYKENNQNIVSLK